MLFPGQPSMFYEIIKSELRDPKSNSSFRNKILAFPNFSLLEKPWEKVREWKLDMLDRGAALRKRRMRKKTYRYIWLHQIPSVQSEIEEHHPEPAELSQTLHCALWPPDFNHRLHPRAPPRTPPYAMALTSPRAQPPRDETPQQGVHPDKWLRSPEPVPAELQPNFTKAARKDSWPDRIDCGAFTDRRICNSHVAIMDMEPSSGENQCS